MGYRALLKLPKIEYYKSSAFLPKELTVVTSYNTGEGVQIQAPEQLAGAAQSFSPPPEPIADPPQMGWRSAKTKPAQTEVLMHPSVWCGVSQAAEHTREVDTYEDGVAGPLEDEEDVREDALVVWFVIMQSDA